MYESCHLCPAWLKKWEPRYNIWTHTHTHAMFWSQRSCMFQWCTFSFWFLHITKPTQCLSIIPLIFSPKISPGPFSLLFIRILEQEHFIHSCNFSYHRYRNDYQPLSKTQLSINSRPKSSLAFWRALMMYTELESNIFWHTATNSNSTGPKHLRCCFRE